MGRSATPSYKSIAGRAIGLLAGLTLLFGCGGPAREAGPGGSAVRRIAVSKLPGLGEPLPQRLDGGRVTISPPAGWQISPRDSSFLIRFQEDPHQSYPTIVVKADDASGPIQNVTRDTVHDFARQVAAEFQKGRSQKTVIEPVEVGSFVGIDYERRARARHRHKEIIVERLILETVVDGRRYSIDLRTRDQDLANYRPHVFAVAAGMKFHEQGGPAEAGSAAGEAPPEPGPFEPPAEPGAERKKPDEPGAEEPAFEFEEEL